MWILPPCAATIESNIYTCVFLYIYMYICLCVYVCTYIFIYIYICTCIFMYMYIYTYIYIYTHTYVCIYIYIWVVSVRRSTEIAAEISQKKPRNCSIPTKVSVVLSFSFSRVYRSSQSSFQRYRAPRALNFWISFFQQVQ